MDTTSNFTPEMKEHWVETLKRWDSEGKDFGQVSNLEDRIIAADDDTFCALGVLMDATMVSSHKYKPTIRSRIRNVRERVGYWVGSKIAGFNLDYREWDY